MARNFPGNATTALERTGAPPATYPYSMLSWFRPANTYVGSTPFGVTFKSATSAWQTVSYSTPGAGIPNSPGFHEVQAAGSQDSFSLAAAPVLYGVWNCMIVVAASITSRILYINNIPGATNTTSLALGTMDTVTVSGGYFGSATTRSSFAAGDIAHCAYWTAGLTAAEVLALSSGVSPLSIQAGSLWGYWPINGGSPEPDLSGNARDLTVAGSPAVVDGPPMMPGLVVAESAMPAMTKL